MTACTAVQNETVWLRKPSYRVKAINPKLAHYIPLLTTALRRGVTAQEDPARQGFYGMELNGQRFYFHVHEESRTAYLVAVSA